MRLLVSTSWLVAIAFSIVLTWVVCLVSLSLVDSAMQRDAEANANTAMASLEVRWRTTRDIAAGAVAAVVAFVQGGIARTRSATGNDAMLPSTISRLENIFGPRLLEHSPNPSGIFLAYQGTITQLYPPTASAIIQLGTDVEALGACGATAVNGTSNTSVTAIWDSSRSARHILLCLPVYSVGNLSSPSGDFWGFAMVSIAEASFAAEGSTGDEYIISIGHQVLVNTHLIGANATCTGLESFVPFGDAALRLVLCVINDATYLSSAFVLSSVILIPAGAAFIGLVVFHAVVGIMTALVQRELKLHAPMNPPVAVAVVGICNAELLWERYPKIMHHVMKAFNARVAVQRDQLHGLHTDAPLQHTSNIVFKDVTSAILMCMQLITDLVQRPISAPDVSSVDSNNDEQDSFDKGEQLETEAAVVAAAEEAQGSSMRNGAQPHRPNSIDGPRFVPISVSCMVHWCPRVILRDHDLTTRYVQCHGEDITLGSKLYHFSSSNSVVVSESAAENAVQDSSLFSIQRYGQVLLRGSKTTQKLYAVRSSTHPHLAVPAPASTGEFLKARSARSDATHLLTEFQRTEDHSSSNVPFNPLQGAPSRNPTDDEGDPHRASTPEADDGASAPSIRKLLTGNIPFSLDRQFAAGFDDLAMFNPNLEYDGIRHVIYHYYCAFQTLFRPFAPAELSNLQRRLVTTFGVSQESLVENLAVRCALRQASEVDNLIAIRQTKMAHGSSSDVHSAATDDDPDG